MSEMEFHGLRRLLLFAHLQWWAMNHGSWMAVGGRKTFWLKAQTSNTRTNYMLQNQSNNYDQIYLFRYKHDTELPSQFNEDAIRPKNR